MLRNTSAAKTKVDFTPPPVQSVKLRKKTCLFPSAKALRFQPCSAGRLRFPRRGAALLSKMTNISTLEVRSFC